MWGRAQEPRLQASSRRWKGKDTNLPEAAGRYRPCRRLEFRASYLRNCRRRSLGCFKPLVCGLLLQRPREAHTFALLVSKEPACAW